MEPKRFYRSRTDRVFAGVCGGLAEYFIIDPLLIRLLFVVLALAGGGGVLIYIILWIVSHENPAVTNTTQSQPATDNPADAPPEARPVYESTSYSQPVSTQSKPPRTQRGLIGGLVLITLGVIFLVVEFVPSVDFGDLWPLILVVIGIGLLYKSIQGRNKKM